MGHLTGKQTGVEARAPSGATAEQPVSAVPDQKPNTLPGGEAPPACLCAPPPGEEDACDVVQVRIPGQPVYISVARQAVDAVSEQIHLPPDARSAVKLAVGEACNNAVLYGLDGEKAGACAIAEATPTVLVACRILRDALEIDVTNEGNGFHPVPGGAAMPVPEDLAEHGRGMALMEMVMDSVEYVSSNGRTVVRMRKRRPASAPCPRN